MRNKLTKVQAVKMFRELIMPQIPYGDKIWQRTAWNDFTDSLCKDGMISNYQYDSWTNPF